MTESNREGQARPPASVPYIVHESIMAKDERQIRRLMLALMLCILLLAVSNLAWLYAWSQYDYTSTSTETETIVQQDGQGINIYGNGNEVSDGTDHDSPGETDD